MTTYQLTSKSFFQFLLKSITKTTTLTCEKVFNEYCHLPTQ